MEDVYGAQEQFGAVVDAQEVEEVSRQDMINEPQLRSLSPLHPSLLAMERQDQAGPSRQALSQHSMMMSRVGHPPMAPNTLEVQLRAGEEAEVTQQAAIALCRFRKVTEDRQAEVVSDDEPDAMDIPITEAEHHAKPAVNVAEMDIKTEAEHVEEPAVHDVVEARVEHTTEPAAGSAMAGNILAENVEIDFGLNVEDMDVEKPGEDTISLNTEHVEVFMQAHIAELSRTATG